MNIILKKICYACLLVLFAQQTAYADDQCSQGLLDLPPRGLSCLYCLHQNAPGGASPIVELLRASCLKQPVIAFVIDGTFGWNESEIRSAISALSTDGRNPWIHFYVYNGPAQRRWDSGFFHSFAVMHPSTFLNKLKTDKGFQGTFRSIVRDRLRPLVSYALSVGAKVSIAPGLEDTLDAEGFRIALNLTKKEIKNPSKITWLRSSCYRCSSHEAQATPPGVQQEVHTSNPSYRVHRGLIHTDGEYFRFTDDPVDTYPLLQSYKRLLNTAEKNGSGFLLWVWKFQDAPPGLIPHSPDSRSYQAPTDSERNQLIQFLRTPIKESSRRR